jgi:hypothetical protein
MTKSQIPMKSQGPNPNEIRSPNRKRIQSWDLGFGAYLGFGAWDLGFPPHWRLGFPRAANSKSPRPPVSLFPWPFP